MKNEVVKTGIRGLDKQFAGGIPKGAAVLLAGSPGTGKTILGVEYIFNGATKFSEKGLIVSFEESEQDIKKQANQFGWDLGRLEKDKKIIIWTQPANRIEKDSIESIIRIIKTYNIQRVVIDSISTLAFNTPIISDNIREIEDISIKRFMYTFVHRLKETGVTSLLISHNRINDGLSIDGVSEFICDGIISLKFQPMGGEYSRSLIIQKMRNAKNDEDFHPLEISKRGVVVHNIE